MLFRLESQSARDAALSSSDLYSSSFMAQLQSTSIQNADLKYFKTLFPKTEFSGLFRYSFLACKCSFIVNIENNILAAKYF